MTEKLTEKEILTEFYNGHYRRMIACKINIIGLESLNPNESIGTLPGPIKDSRVEMKVKDFLEVQKKQIRGHQKTLKVIDKLLNDKT